MSINSKSKRDGFIARNNSLCSSPGCTLPRVGTRKWCRRHARSVDKHGGPNGRAITKRELQPFHKSMEEFIERYSHHPGIKRGIKFLDDIMTVPSGSPRLSPKDAELARLVDKGLTGKEALVIVASVFLFSKYSPRILPVGPELTFAFADALLKARPQAVITSYWDGQSQRRAYKTVGTKVRRSLGETIMSGLSGLLYTLSAHFDKIEAEEKQRNLDYREPFTPNNEEGTEKLSS